MLCLVLYSLLMLFLCTRHGRPDKSAYYVCGRSASTPSLAFSILASCIGGSATIGMIGLAWQCGYPAFWWLGSGAIGLFILGLLLAKKIRVTNATTMPEVIAIYLGQGCQRLSAAIILASNLAVIAAQFSALGLLIDSLAHAGFAVSTLIGATGLTAYTLVGGQQAVMKSDLWQFMAIAAALLLAFLLFLAQPQSAKSLAKAPLELYNASLPPSRAVYFLLIFGSSFTIGPMIFGRLLSAKTPQAAASGSLWAALGMALMAAMITCIGICLQGVAMPADTLREDALFAGMAQTFPGWAVIFVNLGLISAVISSADSCLITGASALANDLLKKGGVPGTRACMLAIAIVSCAMVFIGKGVLSLLLAASDIFVCGIVPPLFIALLTGPGSNRALNAAGMAVGGILGLAAALSGNPIFSFMGMGCSAILSGATLLAGRQRPFRKVGKPLN